MVRVLRREPPVEVEIDGRVRRVWMIFIGNCRYEPSGFTPAWRERLDDGRFDVRLVTADRRFALLRLVVGALTGRLKQTGVYEEQVVDRLTVRSLDGPLRLARDGETFDGGKEFTIEKAKEPLAVYAPER